MTHKYAPMFELKNDGTVYYHRQRFNTENGVITKLKNLKVNKGARITFMLKLETEETVADYFPDAKEYQEVAE